MRPKFTSLTLTFLTAWLFLQNFNSHELPKRPEAAGKSTYKIKRVVLDAGHGGKDPGCIGASSREKHNALGIVLKLGAMLENNYPDLKVIYTRKTDVFVELNERANIANRNNADLFISVHCNAISVSHIHGAETYVLGLHRAEDNLEVAKRENSAIFYEDNYEQNYGGYDPNSTEAHILTSMWQSAYLDQSILFAGYVQKHISDIAGRRDRGVKQAGFLVLRETAMPAVLVESGYLTNRTEEQYIASDKGQHEVAQSLFLAFRDYKQRMEGSLVEADFEYAAPADPSPVTPSIPQARPVRISNAQNPAYRILLASWPLQLDTNSGQLAKLKNVTEEFSDGRYHYFMGTFATYKEAETELEQVQQMGFRTATILTSPEKP